MPSSKVKERSSIKRLPLLARLENAHAKLVPMERQLEVLEQQQTNSPGVEKHSPSDLDPTQGQGILRAWMEHCHPDVHQMYQEKVWTESIVD